MQNLRDTTFYIYSPISQLFYQVFFFVQNVSSKIWNIGYMLDPHSYQLTNKILEYFISMHH